MARVNTTDSLLENAVSGSESAFNVLYDRFAKRLQAFVSGRIGGRLASHVQAEDIVQEVFAEVFTRISLVELRGKGTFYQLLLTVARRRIIDFDRRLSVRPEGMLGPEDAGDALPSRQTGPLTRLLRSEERDLCRAAFDELPAASKEILWLRLVEERTAGEISRLTGKSVGAVWVWFHRALKAWYEKFSDLRDG